ncbi:MAG: hypothetical protein AMS25_15390 [Gemmatimonas sp. SM23_52]|nr:MAG: hypothetical protein AMS25_15390 [Gemmatimonas sp. SM23_52]
MRAIRIAPLSVVLATVSASLSASTGTAQLERQLSEKIAIICPKNLAVFHVLVILSPAGEERRQFIDHPLADAAREYFAGFADHPAVQVTDRMFRSSWYFGLNFIAFHYSEFPEAQQTRAFPELPELTEGMKAMMSQYVELARDFYSVSNFEAFWNAHAAEIESMIEQTAGAIRAPDLPQMMEGFYGREVERFVFVPSPFMQQSGMHVELEDDGRWTFYYVAGGDIATDTFYNTYFAFHEFGHSFIEPISARHAERLNQLAYLYRPLQERFRQLGYRTWDRAFNEHLITAGQLHLSRPVFGEERVTELLERERANGFQLIDRFYGYLSEYASNRDRYPDLETFFPVILDDLATLRVEEYRRPGLMGFRTESDRESVVVREVIEGSAFAEAGVQGGDVIIGLDGIPITTYETFREARERSWNQAAEGDSVQVVVLRGDTTMVMAIPVAFVTDYRYLEAKED